MDFAAAFLHALCSAPHLTPNLNPSVLYETLYELNPFTDQHLITLYARSTVEAEFPFFFDIMGLDCYCLLYTTSGNGKLKKEADAEGYLLEPGSFLLFDCRQHFILQSLASLWKFQVIFAGGGSLPFYMRTLQESFGCLFTPPPEFFHFQLLFQTDTSENIINKLSDEKNMTALFVTLLSHLFNLQNPVPHIPEYLIRMKQLFDQHFERSYSLDELECTFSTSKYRLCREFSHYFGESPTQYLNHVRIARSKTLLRDTNLKIHEVGSSVGIKNTSHFIRLFKRFEGITPLMYRETGLQY